MNTFDFQSEGIALMGLALILMSLMASPVGLCLAMITQILICSFEVAVSKNILWVNFVFLMIFFGGLMVLFIYISSVCQNEPLSLNLSLLWLAPFVGFVSVSLGPPATFSGLKCDSLYYFSSSGWSLGVLAIFYLLVVMILVVKITYPANGALRVE